jgi:hypothetical protein
MDLSRHTANGNRVQLPQGVGKSERDDDEGDEAGKEHQPGAAAEAIGRE